MICRQCLTRASALVRRPPQRAPFSILAARRNATEASAMPPLSTPTTALGEAPPRPAAPAAEPRSICPTGTVLTGLNYFKGKEDPVALPDEAYPEWLWKCLELPPKPEADTTVTAEEFSKSKKQRRLAAKRQRQRMERIMASGDVESLAPKIPLERQTVNLPDGKDGALEHVLEAEQKRLELKKAMRADRKRKIKENNFLRSM